MTTELKHGEAVAYERHGCRCSKCKEGHAQKIADGRARRKQRLPLAPGDPQHGRLNGYRYHGCRCNLCVAAYHRYNEQDAKLRPRKLR